MDQQEIALQIKESIQDSLLNATGKFGAPLASGNLLSSINVIPNDDFGYDILMEAYGLAIENGRAQAFAPVQPILKWVREKRIKPRERGQTQESIAYAIARGMGLNGKTEPRPFIVKGIEAASASMLDETAEIVFEQLDEVFK